MHSAVFVTGTGTDVGKTFVTALITKKIREAGWKAGYFKAALSGAEQNANGEWIPGDAAYVNRIAGLTSSFDAQIPYVYRAAVSPHLAAREEGNPLEMEVVQAKFAQALSAVDYLSMEGSGGIICPIRIDNTQEIWLTDIIRTLKLGVLLVADAGLGTINATALTAHYLRSQNIPLRGIILNQFDDTSAMHQNNQTIIEQLTERKIIARVPHNATELDCSIESLLACYEEIQWQ